MTRREAERLTRQANTLQSFGFTDAEAEALRRISMTLHRWFEHECNGAIQRDGENGDGDPFWFNIDTGKVLGRVADRERGAIKRLEAIVSERNKRAVTPGSSGTALGYYIQGDPRGAALYILRPGDVPEGHDAGAYYSRGIAVY